MSAWTMPATVLVAFAIVVAFVVYLDLFVPDPLKHDTTRWAVIVDEKGDRMAVEPSDDGVWARLVQMREDGSRRWVGGIVERYDNAWGFRFRRDTVNASEVTAEGLQATIRFISENLDEWLGGWGYVHAAVAEVRGP